MAHQRRNPHRLPDYCACGELATQRVSYTGGRLYRWACEGHAEGVLEEAIAEEA